MAIKIKYFFIVLFLFLNYSSFSQNSGVSNSIPVVIVDLNQQNIANAIPFDVPFIIKGKALGYTSIAFSYDLINNGDKKNKKRKWMIFPKNSEKGMTWSSIMATTNTDSFSVKCPGIHPNYKYKFKFILSKNPDLNQNEIDSLKRQVSNVIEIFVDSHINDIATPEQMTAVSKEINSLMRKTLNVNDNTIICDKKTGDAYTVSLFETQLKSKYNDLRSFIQVDSTDEKKIANDIDQIAVDFTSNLTQIRGHVSEALYNNGSNLSGASKELLNETYNPGLSNFIGYKVKDGLKILELLTISQNSLNDLLNGKLRIVNNDLEPTDSLDMQSVFFLESTLQLLKSSAITNTRGVNIFFSDSIIYLDIRQFLVDRAKKINNEAKLKVQEKTIPDLTIDKYVVDTRIDNIDPVIDIVTENSPYISADAGIGYIPAFKNGYSYFGANFYFTPINKQAKISKFRGANKVKKMISFNVGVANIWGLRPVNTISILGQNSSWDPLIGFGCRLGRILKINISILPYKSNNENPYVNDYKLNAAACFSAGIDINILKAFTSIAKALNLTQ